MPAASPSAPRPVSDGPLVPHCPVQGHSRHGAWLRIVADSQPFRDLATSSDPTPGPSSGDAARALRAPDHVSSQTANRYTRPDATNDWIHRTRPHGAPHGHQSSQGGLPARRAQPQRRSGRRRRRRRRVTRRRRRPTSRVRPPASSRWCPTRPTSKQVLEGDERRLQRAAAGHDHHRHEQHRAGSRARLAARAKELGGIDARRTGQRRRHRRHQRHAVDHGRRRRDGVRRRASRSSM